MPRKEKAEKIKTEKIPNIDSRLLKMVKGELFTALASGDANWQKARATITKHARRVAGYHGLLAQCCRCGYSKHVETCHVIGVMDFPDTATLGEINALSNLLGLCPNCHWEFDHGMSPAFTAPVV